MRFDVGPLVVFAIADSADSASAGELVRAVLGSQFSAVGMLEADADSRPLDRSPISSWHWPQHGTGRFRFLHALSLFTTRSMGTVDMDEGTFTFSANSFTAYEPAIEPA